MLATHPPKQSHLLAALPPADYERLLPDLEQVPVVKLESDRLLSRNSAIAEELS